MGPCGCEELRFQSQHFNFTKTKGGVAKVFYILGKLAKKGAIAEYVTFVSAAWGKQLCTLSEECLYCMGPLTTS